VIVSPNVDIEPGAERPIRVLHAPVNIAAHPATLARFERKLGFDSRAIVLRADANFPADAAMAPADARVRVVEAGRWRLLWHALQWADVVHLYFGKSLLVSDPSPSLAKGFRQSRKGAFGQLYARAIWLKDLPLLRACGKIIVMTWQGDDARQGDVSRRLFDVSIAHVVGDDYYNSQSDHWKRRAIATIGRYAHYGFALNPDLLHVLPTGTEFLPYANADISTFDAVRPSERSVPVIVHAPTSRVAKGTPIILAALDRLKAEGVAFELDLVEGRPRPEAIGRYRRADLVVDQLYAGWYGGFAVEVMALGKPVVAYLRESDFSFVPPQMRSDLPIISTTPDKFYDCMKVLLTIRQREWPEIGARSRRFVERWHDPSAVAKRVTDVYRQLLARRDNRLSLPGRLRGGRAF
jgi:glycosyltransferase involved in cell wall biosynthesis